MSDVYESVRILPRGKRNQLQVGTTVYLGARWVDVRMWWEGPDGTWYRTKRGIMIRPEEIEEIQHALALALGQIRRASPSHRPRR